MRILIADDHTLFRDGLRLVLAGLEGEFDSPVEILEASSYTEALDQAKTGVDLVLLDLVMPGLPWTKGLDSIKQSLPKIPVIILSASTDRRLVLEAVRLGASGFIAKTSNARVMISAVKLVLSGGVYLPTSLLDTDTLPEGGINADPTRFLPDALEAASATRPEAAPPAPDIALTPRQKEVLVLLAQGQSNKEIARALDLSEGTVKLHVTAILKTLGVSNRTGAVVAANRLGLTTSATG